MTKQGNDTTKQGNDSTDIKLGELINLLAFLKGERVSGYRARMTQRQEDKVENEVQKAL